METSEKNTRMHIGRKISRIRELRGMKQDALATELGISQQAISKLEQSVDIDDSVLDKVAKVLGVSVDAIRSFSEEAVINIISSNLHDNAGSVNNNCTLNFNPVDKLMEALEANKVLYERLLASEQEKVNILRQR